MRTFKSGHEFLEYLRRADFAAPFHVTGMVKAHESSTDVIMFAPNECSTWHEIPIAAVLQAEVLGQKKCKDHTHPLVRLELEPSDQEVVRILTDYRCSDSSDNLSRVICRALRDYPDDPGRILEVVGPHLAKNCEQCVERGVPLFYHHGLGQ